MGLNTKKWLPAAALKAYRHQTTS